MENLLLGQLAKNVSVEKYLKVMERINRTKWHFNVNFLTLKSSPYYLKGRQTNYGQILSLD